MQTGFALACGLVKYALPDKFLFFGDRCLCRVQTVSRLFGFCDILFQLWDAAFFLGKLQAGGFCFCRCFPLRSLHCLFAGAAGMSRVKPFKNALGCPGILL